ncbi:MAG: hypothetical protein ACYT04_59415 [Nostoc sp.]
MTGLTLQQVFGSSATQNATTVTFLKSELLGLTPQVINTADSILAGIVNNAWQYFEGNLTDQNGIIISDESGNPVTYDNHYYYTVTWLQFWGYLLPLGKVNIVFLLSELSPYGH